MGQDLAPTPIIQIQDGCGNRPPGQNGYVVVDLVDARTLAPVDGVLQGLTAYGLTNGEAVLPYLSVRAPGLYRLRASAGSATSVSDPFSVYNSAADASPGASTLTLAQPTAPADGTRVTFVATVRDAFGNPIPGAAVSLRAVGGADVQQDASRTDAGGQVTGSVGRQSPGVDRVEAVVDGLVVALAQVTFTTIPSAAASTIDAAPSPAPADGTTPAVVTVTVLDAAAAPVAGAKVALAYAGPATITPISDTSDASGRATFAVFSGTVCSGALQATVNPGAGATVLSASPNLDFTSAIYKVGGTLYGLLFYSGLSLSSPGLPDLALEPRDYPLWPSWYPRAPWEVPATSPLPFAFRGWLVDGAPYSVGVASQPAWTRCEVTGGSGTVQAGHVDSVGVTCQPHFQSVKALLDGGRATTTYGEAFVWTAGNACDPMGFGTDGMVDRAGYLETSVFIDQQGVVKVLTAELPVVVPGLPAWSTLSPPDGAAQVATSGLHHFVRSWGGRLYGWGANGCGQVGEGTFSTRTSAVLVATGIAEVSASGRNSAAVTTDGRLLTWGCPDSGQLGRAWPPFEYPAPVAGGGWLHVAVGGASMYAVTTDGKLYAWGANSLGQLGDGTTQDRPAPVLVGTGFSQVAASGGHALALATDGRLFAWGENAYGQIGDGTTVARLVPKQVGSGFVSAAAGDGWSAAVTSDGRLFRWGRAQDPTRAASCTVNALVPAPARFGHFP